MVYGTMCNVNEIIQYYFNNLQRIQLRTKKENETDNSADYNDRSYRDYHSDSKDSMCMKNDDNYDFDCSW